MPIVEHHTSPDDLFTLIVDVTESDWTIGFSGYSWHTHGDILSAWGCDGSPSDAMRTFVDEIIGSKRPFLVYREDGAISDVAVQSDYDDPASEENVEVRLWNGNKSLKGSAN